LLAPKAWCHSECQKKQHDADEAERPGLDRDAFTIHSSLQI
jgi:hypothetical protein